MKLQNIKITELKESKINPRGREFSGPEFDDLVASIKEKGVLVPIIVRQTSKSDHSAAYEIVAGARRFRAAKIAGLEEIPATIQQLTDFEAREVQIIENLHREGIHPLEEGEAYRKLIEESKYEIKSVAAKVGKSETYVRQRLFLTNLIEKVAGYYRAGKVNDGQAVVIARLSPGNQEIVMKEISDRSWRLNSLKDLENFIKEKIYSPMEFQPWLKTPELKLVVGKCIECQPMNADLFGEAKPDKCNNLKCWMRKMSVYINYRAKTEKLVKVTKEWNPSNKSLIGRDNYKTLSSKEKDHCKFAKKAIVAEGEDIGTTIFICFDKECRKHSDDHSIYERTLAEKARRKKEIEKAKKAKLARNAHLERALKVVNWPLNKPKHLEALFALACDNTSANTWRSVAKRRELKVEKKKGSWGSSYYDYRSAVESIAQKMNATEKARLAFEFLIDTGYESHHKGIGKLTK